MNLNSDLFSMECEFVGFCFSSGMHSENILNKTKRNEKNNDVI